VRILLVLVTFLALVACSQTGGNESSVKKSPVIRKTSKLIAPKGNTTVKFAEAIQFEVQTRDESMIDSIRLESPNETRTFTESNFAWTPEKPRAGTPQLRLIVYMGEKKESLYPKVRFLPVEEPKEYTCRLINTFPHDVTAWTQGLFIFEDTLFEGTGRKGESVLRKSDLTSGRVYQELKLDDDFFGEGIVMYEDKIFQLTWQSRRGFVYDRDFQELQTFQYPTEGWGLTNLGDQLVMSDGSEKLYVMDPGSFAEVDRLEVYDHTGKVDQLNELEMVEGLIYANVWFEEYIVMVDPASGAVIGKLDLTGLLQKTGNDPDVVLNGIAYNEETGHLFVTGKLYPELYEIEIVEKPSS